MVVRVIVLTIVAVLLAGCGGDEPAVTTTGTGLTGASTETVTWKEPTAEVELLSDVSAESQPGYDRVVFEFQNGTPGGEVGYRERPIVADGSGEEVSVGGQAVLVVRMEPALDADLTQESAPRTYTGPTRFSPTTTTAVVELVRTGGFEAVLTWAIGVDEKRPFRVTRLENPARIVIDIDSN